MSAALDSDVLIIGSGAAGYTAAIYAARAGLSPVVLRGPQPGGQLTITTDVENFPGFSRSVQGPWLMDQLAEQAENAGARLVSSTALGCDLLMRPFRVWDRNSAIYSGRSLIIATGARARWLGLPGEKQYMGAGVSGCSVCDGVLFKGREVAIVGGGSTAFQEAAHLLHHASKVTIIHRGSTFRADRTLQARVLADPRVNVVMNTVVTAVIGEAQPNRLTGLELADVPSGKTSQLACDGLFVAIGHTPATAIFEGQIDLDDDGYIETPAGSTMTSVPGVFAAGDVMDRRFRQAVTAAGFGCIAALEAEEFLQSAG